MSERKYDRMLGIRTTGLREWVGKTEYNRYEATPYLALDTLFRAYRFSPDDQVVDFGCGRGRVAFYIHHHFQIPVIGIEANEITLEEAYENQFSYERKMKLKDVPIHFEYGLAQLYQIKPEDNCFYFFNPFSANIFRKVVNNILHSLRKYPRRTDLILYYPMPKFKQFLRAETPFQILNKVKVPKVTDHREKFIIYRYVLALRLE